MPLTYFDFGAGNSVVYRYIGVVLWLVLSRGNNTDVVPHSSSSTFEIDDPAYGVSW